METQGTNGEKNGHRPHEGAERRRPQAVVWQWRGPSVLRTCWARTITAVQTGRGLSAFIHYWGTKSSLWGLLYLLALFLLGIIDAITITIHNAPLEPVRVTCTICHSIHAWLDGVSVSKCYTTSMDGRGRG